MGTHITLRLDEKIIGRIRRLAVEHASVPAWIAELVTRTVEELDGFEPARQRALRALATPVKVPEATVLTRGESHKR